MRSCWKHAVLHSSFDRCPAYCPPPRFFPPISSHRNSENVSWVPHQWPPTVPEAQRENGITGVDERGISGAESSGRRGSRTRRRKMINHPVDSLYGCRTCRYTVSTTTSLISRSIGAALSVASGSPGTVLPIPNEEGRKETSRPIAHPVSLSYHGSGSLPRAVNVAVRRLPYAHRPCQRRGENGNFEMVVVAVILHV
jgi:hypothetical protein